MKHGELAVATSRERLQEVERQFANDESYPTDVVRRLLSRLGYGEGDVDNSTVHYLARRTNVKPKVIRPPAVPPFATFGLAEVRTMCQYARNHNKIGKYDGDKIPGMLEEIVAKLYS